MTILYKFRSIGPNVTLLDGRYVNTPSHTYSILENGTLWFASPESLNDPLDSQTDSVFEFERWRSKYEPRAQSIIDDLNTVARLGGVGPAMTLAEAAKEYKSRLGIFSLATDPSNPLMWAHYAESHKGLVLGFDWESLQGIGAPYSGWLKPLQGKVRYRPFPVFVPILAQVFQELLNAHALGAVRFRAELQRIHGNLPWKLVESNVLVKHDVWSYEGEHRIVREFQGNLKFNKRALREVIFGARIDPAEETKVRALIRKRGYNVSYFRSELIPGAFELKKVPLTP